MYIVLCVKWPLCNPMDCSPPGSSVHGDSPGKNTEVGRRAFLQGIFPIQGLNPDLLQLQADSFFFSLLTEPAGKPKNTGVGSLSFSKGSSCPGIKPGSPALQADSLPAELPGKSIYIIVDEHTWVNIKVVIG